MKLMIASDLHGSAYYVRKLMDAYAAEQPDRLLLLGDLLYHGPRNPLPRDYDCMAVAELLAGARDRIAAVRGNCDCEVDQMVLPFPILADYALLEADGVWLYATHGHIWNEERLPPMAPGTVLLNGHFHVPACREHEGYVYMNPGSVSIPKEGSAGSYMVAERGTFLWKNLAGETYRTYSVK